MTMHPSTTLTPDQVDVLERKVGDVFDVVIAHLFEAVNEILAVEGIPHQAVARINRYALELEQIRAASQTIMMMELRGATLRALH